MTPKEFWANLNIILWYLPDQQQTTTHTTYHQAPVDYQIWIGDKWIINGIIKGIYGTTMGLYNTHKLNKLKECLEQVEAQQTQRNH